MDFNSSGSEPRITFTLSEFAEFVRILVGPGGDVRIDRLVSDVKAIRTSLVTLNQKQETIMADLTAISQEVAAVNGVEDSAILALQRLEEAVKAAGTDQAALDALTSQLAAKRGELAAAIAANPTP